MDASGAWLAYLASAKHPVCSRTANSSSLLFQVQNAGEAPAAPGRPALQMQGINDAEKNLLREGSLQGAGDAGGGHLRGLASGLVRAA